MRHFDSLLTAPLNPAFKGEGHLRIAQAAPPCARPFLGGSLVAPSTWDGEIQARELMGVNVPAMHKTLTANRSLGPDHIGSMWQSASLMRFRKVRLSTASLLITLSPHVD